MYRNRGVFATAGQRLMALANAIPPPMPDLEDFFRTPDANSYALCWLATLHALCYNTNGAPV
ncbi:hypothetical protein [Roseiflexus sp.]|uniref:hypothetical protein n=1 Tax=Roseiflexus sp. TaxID=2562120 RepID=UPI00398B75ED